MSPAAALFLVLTVAGGPGRPSDLSTADMARLERGETVSRPVPMPGKHQRAGIAARIVARDPERVFRAIADVDHWNEWVPFLESAERVQDAPGGPSRRLRFDLPWPLRDRHYRALFRVERSAAIPPAPAPAEPRQPPPEREWVLTWTSVPDSGNVEWAQSSLHVRGHGPDRSLVVFRSATDVGESLYTRPLMDRAMEDSLLWVLDALAQQVDRCRYTVPWPAGCEEERPSRP